MLLAYLKRQYKLLLLLAGAVCIFAAVFALYDLPLEAVLYAGALCLALGLVLFAVGYSRFLRRHRELQRLLRQAGEKALPLPPARGLLEEDYQTLLQAVCRDRARLAAENESRFRELTDYYSLWVHQIKTPIAAMDLLLQEDDSPHRGELEMELLKIGQYVEMVLSYLRLDSDSTDYVLREYPLDDILRQAVRKFAKMFILKKITLDFQETGKTVLTDEPTGALDSRSSDNLLELFGEINKGGQTILMVTHSVKAASHAGRVLFLRDGRVYHQLYRGSESREAQFRRISDTLTVLTQGGENHG